MRLGAALGLLAVLLVHVSAEQLPTRERHYYIAAVPVDWNYSHSSGPSYRKVVFREYEERFSRAKTHPSSLGLLGPTLRGEEGETIVVTFRNMADRPYSIHPHGIAYGKHSEGALYFDNTSQKEKEDDAVQPNTQHIYYWEVTSDVSPQKHDPACLTYTYFSHQNVVRDYNSGLIGTLLICKSGTLDTSGKQLHVHQEVVLLFGVFDEKQSWYTPKGHATDNHVKHTINGHTAGSLPDVGMCAHTTVGLHLMGMSSEPEVFSVHVNGQVLEHAGHKLSSVGLISGSSTTASMVSIHPGRWLLSSHTNKHLKAGMHAFVNVAKCDGFDAPKRMMTVAQKRQSQQWEYFIAAEEILWDYAPNMPAHIDEDYKFQYLKQSATRIGAKYKKAVYTQYKNESFTERSENKQRKNELGILGPVIRAQVRDVIKIVFKNMASRPYSIYPHGLTIEKSEEGVNYPSGGNQTHGVQPGDTHTYVWRVTEENGPLDEDPRCLTRMYHSAVNIPRDIASGLIGPMLICKSNSLNRRNVQLKADKEQQAMFSVFNENESWYLDDNIRWYCDRSKVHKANPDFYQSNIMHTINGYVFESGELLGFCNGEIATWHVSNVGAQDNIQTATFYGHTFQMNEHTEDILSLYPMTGETITMNMDNIGVWLLTSLSSHETTKGMRIKFQDVECFRDYQYEFEYEDKDNGTAPNQFSVLNPLSLDDLQKKEKEPEVPVQTKVDIDMYTEMYIDQLGLRSLKNNSQNLDMEKLDLSFLDYDAVDVPPEDVNVSSTANKTKLSSEISNSVSGPIPSNYTLKWHVVDGQNFTGRNIQKQSMSENTTQKENKMVPSHFYDSSVSKTQNPTVNYTTVVLNSNNITSNMSGLEVESLGNTTVSKTQNTTVNYTIVVLNNNNITSNISGLEVESLGNTTVSKTQNTTVNYTIVVLNNNNITANISGLEVESLGNTTVSKTQNTTVNYTIVVLNNNNITSNISGLEVESLGNTTVSKTQNTTVNYTIVVLNNNNITSNISGLEVESLGNTTVSKTQNTTVNYTIVVLNNNNITSNISGLEVESLGNTTVSKTQNTTVNYTIVVLNNNNITSNMSGLEVESYLGNSTVSKTQNTTVNYTLVVLNNNNITSNVTEIADLSKTLPRCSTSSLDGDKMNVTLASDDQTSASCIQKEDSKERTTKGDVFSYSVPRDDVIEFNVTKANKSLSATGDAEFKHGNFSEASDSIEIGNVKNVTVFKTETIQNVTLTKSNSNVEIMEHGTGLLSSLNHTSSVERFSNKTVVPGNWTFSGSLVAEISSEELNASDSNEEVLIYLKENHTQAIKSSSFKTQMHNWTYDGMHQMETVAIPDHIMKYYGRDIHQTILTPKKTPKIRKVNLRQWPKKGHGMKTKKKKEYKPQSRSGLPFSPRGFNPNMLPRGARPNFNAPKPVTDEENLINKPVVIGVPRPDFSDYELYVPGDEPDHLGQNGMQPDVKQDEYEYVTYKDPYSSHEDIKDLTLDDTTKYYLKFSSPNVKTYFIAAEEVEWDYAGYGQRRQDSTMQDNRATKFTKVVFRGYIDSTFSIPDIRGEIGEHLGILGPVIKVEVGQSIMLVFRNNANRPYSLHPNGVYYTKQTEGLSYEDGSKYWYKYDNEVQPNTTFTYLWKVNSLVGPKPGESDCRTWVYYSGVNPERDIHSGLIGPILVCRGGTLEKKVTNMRTFTLLFMIFDESQSWYYMKNREMMERKSRRIINDPSLKEKLKFHSINGIIYSLKGLRMYTNQLVYWHLINMGSPNDFQSVHFHGQTFLLKKTNSYRQAVYPLLPGSFATLEMIPPKPGLWQLETEVGFNQQKGMQTLFLVLDNECYRPLGLQSGSVKDNQITAINTRGYWKPHFARLNNQGRYNAWSTEQNNSWIQVDFLRPVVISQVATQGAKELFHSQFVTEYFISYSTDRRKWIFYKGDSKDFRKIFTGNQESYETKTNTFFPPLIGRFIRLHPHHWYKKQTVRMEFYGCELDGCSVPLGMENGLIEDHHITASSTAYNWYSGSWKPSYARLNKQGTANAWKAEHSDLHQWLQVELPQVKKITGIVTQGARSLGTEMYVTSYRLQHSSDGTKWTHYMDDEDYTSKTFMGNTDNNSHVKNYIYPPIFSRFIRIVPIMWHNAITMRIELLGCDFE
ncbi:coagulation factor V [Thalassophryne amazonica]|uniref:coagulation factor V n=1 Tax=Thalassophryne amazonica TaxID=390379 RepID=UPI001471F838|nr:coagulation factor V [Thalassophryne amazonica]